MRIAIYARVSTDDKGQDPENQLRELRAWCANSGHTITREYVEHESGRKGADKRKQFAALFEDAGKRKFDCGLFWVEIMSGARRENEDVLVTVEASSDNTTGDSCIVWIPPVPKEVPLQIIDAHFQANPQIGSVPQQPSSCSCVSSSGPSAQQSGLFKPFPNGTMEIFTNNCGQDVSLFGAGETKPSNVGIPLVVQSIPYPAEGRTFSYETLHPGQRLRVNLSGIVAGGVWDVIGCPPNATQVLPPPPTNFACVSNKYITPTAVEAHPVACQANGSSQPGTPCLCKEGSMAYDGVNWMGPLPPR